MKRYRLTFEAKMVGPSKWAEDDRFYVSADRTAPSPTLAKASLSHDYTEISNLRIEEI